MTSVKWAVLFGGVVAIMMVSNGYAEVQAKQVLIESRLVEISTTVSEQLIYETVSGRDVTAEIAALVRTSPEKTVVEASIVSYGRGADYRKIETRNPLLIVPTVGEDGNIKMTVRPQIEKIYVQKPAAAGKVAPFLFAAIGSQYEGAGRRAADHPGQVCPVTGEKTGGSSDKSGFSTAIDKAGMAAGMGMLASQAKGELEGVKARWEFKPQLQYQFDIKFEAYNKNDRRTENLTQTFDYQAPTDRSADGGDVKPWQIGVKPSIFDRMIEDKDVKLQYRFNVMPLDHGKIKYEIDGYLFGKTGLPGEWVPRILELEYAATDYRADGEGPRDREYSGGYDPYYEHDWDDFDEEGYCECGYYEPEADMWNYDEDGNYHGPAHGATKRVNVAELLRKLNIDPTSRITVSPDVAQPIYQGTQEGQKAVFIGDFPVTRILLRTDAYNAAAAAVRHAGEHPAGRMNGTSATGAIEVISAIVTPAILILATSSLITATANRQSRLLERVRDLTREVEGMGKGAVGEKRDFLASQLVKASARTRLIQRSLAYLYLSLGVLILTCVLIGMGSLTGVTSTAIILGGIFLSMALLFYASFLLIRESRIALRAVDAELEYVKRLA